MSTGSPSSLASTKRRLTHVASHLRTPKLKVVVCRDLGPNVMPLLRDRPEIDLVVWPEDKPCERPWLLENIRGAAGVLVMLSDKVNQELIDAAGPSLKVASTMSVGYEHVDLPVVAKAGVRIGYTPDVLTDAVADLTVMLALMASRNGGEAVSLVQSGGWPSFSWSPFGLCGPQISASPFSPKRTVGFLGFGRIAQATLARLVPFGITHCLFTSNPSSTADPAFEAAIAAKYGVQVRRVGLDELARESDVLVVLAPGGARTHHVVNEEVLRKMKKTAVLVNTARGTVVDSDALARALREGWIWGAGLDVVEGEPNVTADHPLVKEPRAVVLPHLGSATIETRLGMATLAAKNLLGGLGLEEGMPAELDVKSRA
ncbi:hypothetical protein PUNSTDRAFT_102598 [Punctularia strigosozonata HHB-11173 SS5]|uniref:uncharacterized protein n=1 Tax=Punctularia strigosozonata (strain HHB-11173) TaxID=741275 RepID=UPI0004416BEE|nr:uncharacterized protein PUNSTDRAFT_102598 [Punctularia strigosozonata HHB-11173 SS5]EIN09053.1 hypothetical protein PUNSTDRAFT_102598 [Punctularia strigosozonata HHB-11173 SS5]